MNLSCYYETIDGDLFCLDPDFTPILNRAEKWLAKMDHDGIWWKIEGKLVMWQMPLAMGESEIERRNKQLWGAK